MDLEKSHYELLGVDPGATQDEVKAAYRTFALQAADPRRAEGSWPNMEEAFRVLSDPMARAKYDREIAGTGKIIGGDTLLIRQISEGSIGRTYLARDIPTGRLVVVKHCSRLSADNLGRLRDEARKMFDLSHHAIPTVRRLIELPDQSLALVLAYKPGETLEQIVTRLGRIHPDSATWIIERVLNVLWFMHNRGVVHGAIEPHNVIVDEKTFSVYVVDFGLAQLAGAERSRPVEYVECFAPPEQQVGDPLLPESDLYSLGATFVYLLSGGDLSLVRTRQVPLSLDERLKDFIRKLLSYDILDRPRSARELFQEIRSLREELYQRRHSMTGSIQPA